MKRYIDILTKPWAAMLAMNVFITLAAAVSVGFFKVSAHYDNIKVKMYATVICMLLVIYMVIMANLITKRRIKKLKSFDLPVKLEKYMAISINRLVFYAGVCGISFVMAFFTGDLQPLLFAVLAILLIITNKPNEVKVKYDLELTQADISEFKNMKFETKR